ncbi:type II secretion system protein [Candidatus Uhrbacteria bacterium]|nr:type II secretion system protein [Candidatus Uhrbacteria bacterium]
MTGHRRQVGPPDRNGHILVQIMVLGGLAAVFVSSMMSWAVLNYRAGRSAVERERAIQLAEAGLDYYRWHLAHAPTDFQDGTGQPGPYQHDLTDRDGNVVGHFVLEITPPDTGSSEVTVRSSGDTGATFSPERHLTATLTKPSFARYAVAADDFMRFGEGTEVHGPIHSNKGIRFDGLAYNVVSSSVDSYDDPDHSGGNEFGVHTHLFPTDPLPPSAPPSRSDVFMVGRQFPVASVDFDGMTADFAVMKSDAEDGGFYRPSAGAQGYHIVFRTDDTFDLYKATKLLNAPDGCWNSNNQDGWGTWSIENEHLIGNFPLPDNGLIFLEDDVFVDGQIDGARVTVVAAFLPDNPPFRKNIIVNRDLLYTAHDGTDSIGLIAQGHVMTGLVSWDDLRIDAALIAQKGKVGRFYYPEGCSPYHQRHSITLWGMIATAVRYGFAYTDGTGYAFRYINYDGSLFLNPPPSFPLTADQYVVTSWAER